MTPQENDARNARDFFEHRKHVLKMITASIAREKEERKRGKKQRAHR